MAVLKVLLNEKGKVVGTARPHIVAGGPGAPQSATLVARRGQRLIDVEVDEKIASLEPEALHATLSKYARPGKTKGTARSAVGVKRTKAQRSKQGR